MGATVRLVIPIVRGSSHRRRELQWRANNQRELQTKYGGSWIALEGEQILAQGPNAGDVVQEARAKGVRSPYVFFVEPLREGVAWLGL